jgi:hypothetical protein
MIGLIQSYATYCSGLSMTMRSAPSSSTAALTEGLVTSGRVGALEEAIHAR